LLHRSLESQHLVSLIDEFGSCRSNVRFKRI